MSDRAHLLVVNRNTHNQRVLERVLAEAGYETVSATDMAAFDAALEHPERLGLALVDITGFDSAIWERCERLREENIPLLLVAARQSAAVTEAGEQYGANSVLVKPLAIRELIPLIKLLVEA